MLKQLEPARAEDDDNRNTDVQTLVRSCPFEIGVVRTLRAWGSCSWMQVDALLEGAKRAVLGVRQSYLSHSGEACRCGRYAMTTQPMRNIRLGSGTSSSAAFLRAVAPTVGIFQVGHRNRYRHPQKLVYARYGAMGIERIRTDERGAVTLMFGPGLDVTTYRATHARYWYGR